MKKYVVTKRYDFENYDDVCRNDIVASGDSHWIGQIINNDEVFIIDSVRMNEVDCFRSRSYTIATDYWYGVCWSVQEIVEDASGDIRNYKCVDDIRASLKDIEDILTHIRGIIGDKK